MSLLLRRSAKSYGMGGCVGILAAGAIGVMTETDKQKRAARLRDVECPKCKARFLFRRARVPRFDSHGFESYQLHCEHCGASFVGVIDPYDGALLLSAP